MLLYGAANRDEREFGPGPFVRRYQSLPVSVNPG